MVRQALVTTLPGLAAASVIAFATFLVYLTVHSMTAKACAGASERYVAFQMCTGEERRGGFCFITTDDITRFRSDNAFLLTKCGGRPEEL